VFGPAAGARRSGTGVALLLARMALGVSCKPPARRPRRPVPADPVLAAEVARLRYVGDDQPGIRRQRRGRGFRYLGPDGDPVRDRPTLRRIRSLAVPPAWTDVWISPDPLGHLQAVGRDAAGRKQYRYHPRWRAVRDRAKYERLIDFGRSLPAIRARVNADLARPGLPREKVLATVVRLLESTLIRVGNEEYARRNRSYGLTTLRSQHARVDGGSVRFEFRGKGGKRHVVGVSDRRLAAVVRRCQELPGHELFQYVDAEGARQSIGSADVNAYLRDATGAEFTAKDFRTWYGTVMVACALGAAGPPGTARSRKRRVAQAVAEAAQRLGNTPTICRSSYVHPAVVAAYLEGVPTNGARAAPGSSAGGAGLTREEGRVLRLLERRGAPDARAVRSA
jgi:DNA topoisomerase-1